MSWRNKSVCVPIGFLGLAMTWFGQSARADLIHVTGGSMATFGMPSVQVNDFQPSADDRPGHAGQVATASDPSLAAGRIVPSTGVTFPQLGPDAGVNTSDEAAWFSGPHHWRGKLQGYSFTIPEPAFSWLLMAAFAMSLMIRPLVCRRRALRS